jgi:aryl-alcohol dehydrogenase-like predicted oxidoreductase
MSAAQFATLWVLSNRYVTAAIASPRTESQWDEYLWTLKHQLDAEDEAFVNRLVLPGAVSTHGYNDPVFPIEGRVPQHAGAA